MSKPNQKNRITISFYQNRKGNGRYSIRIAEELAIDIALGGPRRDVALEKIATRLTAEVERREEVDLGG